LIGTISSAFTTSTTPPDSKDIMIYGSKVRILLFHILHTQKSRQQVVFAMLVLSCQQVWNKLLTTCNNLVDIIRLVARLLQQVQYNHDITILLQPCVVNLVTFLFYIMTVSDLLEQPCNKSDNAIKLVTSC
jgi:hypothetical protein